MRRQWKVALSGIAMVLLVGCSPAIQASRFETFPPRPPDYPIKLYAEERPNCPYTEVGTLRVTKRHSWVSMDDVTKAFRDKAREMGGDAVVGVAQVGGERTNTGTKVRTALVGTVIRFKKPDCEK